MPNQLEYFTAHALQGLMSNPANGAVSASTLGARAVECAEAAIKSLEIKEEVDNYQVAPSTPVSHVVHRRAANILLAEDVYTIGQLVEMSEVQLLKMPGLGRSTLMRVKGELADQGLRLR